MKLKEFIFTALGDSCKVFVKAMKKHAEGTLSNSKLFLWQALFVNSGNADAAIAFTEANPKCSERKFEDLDKFIAESEGKKIKPTKCSTFGCSTEQIEECHKKLVKNADGEPSNSPAYHIREEVLERYKLREEFIVIKDEVFEKLVSGDTSAHMEDAFLDLAAALKSDDPLAYTKLQDELSGMKVKLTAFEKEVNKRSKARAKDKKAAVVQGQTIDLPDHLKPYAEGADPSTSYVGENGYIFTTAIDGEGNPYPLQLSNFVARIKRVRKFDDGNEIFQQFVINGILEGTKKLPAITVNAEDFRSMNWAERHWGNVLITSAPKARDIVRETIQRVSSKAPVTKVHYTLGWKKIKNQWYYLYSGGSIGDSKVSVAEINVIVHPPKQC